MTCFCSPENPLDKDCPEHGYRFKEYYLPGARKADVQAQENALRERKRIEIYRAAVQIFTLMRASTVPHMLTVPANKDAMFEAVREALELWERVEECLTK